MGVTRLLLLGPFYTIQTKKDQTFCRGVYIRSCRSDPDATDVFSTKQIHQKQISK
jgi:hypothetical protein